MGLVFGAFWLAYALFEIPGGWMGDRIGARFTLTRIVLAWSLFTALTGAATGFYSLLDVSLPVWRRRGGGVSEHGPRSVALAAAAGAGAGRRRAVAVRAVGRGVCAAVVRRDDARRRIVAGDGRRIAAGWIGWRRFPVGGLAFFVSGALGVVWCLAFYPWFRDEPREKASVNAAGVADHRGGRGEVGAGASRRRPRLAAIGRRRRRCGRWRLLHLRQLRLVVLRELDAAVHEGRARRRV